MKEIITASGLKYRITKNGTGNSPVRGDRVRVHYTGKLLNGQVFDSSLNKTSFKFTLGIGEVIEGWDEGVALLKVGSKATFIIPPHLAYGDEEVDALITPNTTLVFDVELISFK
jgi:FKBP-type peptidyl-prolyl cis-trans isomerase